MKPTCLPVRARKGINVTSLAAEAHESRGLRPLDSQVGRQGATRARLARRWQGGRRVPRALTLRYVTDEQRCRTGWIGGQNASVIPARALGLFRHCLFAAAALALAVQFSPRAQAALGDDVSAVAADQARLGASLQVQQRGGYAIHELAAPTGTKVREFVGESGKVFAVSWSGGWRPNLRDIMGAHYDRFIAGTRGRRVARGPVRIELPGMVVVMGGYLRTFFGKVILTDMLPSGVRPEDLR